MPVVKTAAASIRILALGTSTEWCSVALLRRQPDELTVDTSNELLGQGHSCRLLAMIRDLLAESGTGLADLDAIAFDAGPGTFTGLRIGCGVAQGLGFALNTPLIGIGSLAAMAWQAAGYRGALVAADARMGEVYCGIHVRDGAGRMAACGPPVVLGASKAIEWFEAHVTEVSRAENGAGIDCCALGNGFARFPELQAWAAARLLPVRSDAWPSADAIAGLAEGAWIDGATLDAERAAPWYVRDKVAFDVDEQAALRSARAQ